MRIGLGAAVGLWVIFGAAFWSAFVGLGFRFRPLSGVDDAPAPALDQYEPGRASRTAPLDHVLARSQR